MIVFQPKSFPQIFSWTTYGVGVLIKCLKDQFFQEKRMIAEAKGNPVMLHYILELVAAAERLLAFGYTGSARMLVRDLMEPLWMTLNLSANTTPMIRNSIVSTENGKKITIQHAMWPLQRVDGLAARASGTSIALTYSNELAQVSSYEQCFSARSQR
jgi:hypothetical protein